MYLLKQNNGEGLHQPVESLFAHTFGVAALQTQPTVIITTVFVYAYLFYCMSFLDLSERLSDLFIESIWTENYGQYLISDNQ